MEGIGRMLAEARMDADSDSFPSAGYQHISLRVRRAGGDIATISVFADPATFCIAAVKEMIAEREEIACPVDQQTLIFRGRILSDIETLQSARLKNEDMIQLVKTSPNGARSVNPEISFAGDVAGVHEDAKTTALGSAGPAAPSPKSPEFDLFAPGPLPHTDWHATNPLVTPLKKPDDGSIPTDVFMGWFAALSAQTKPTQPPA